MGKPTRHPLEITLQVLEICKRPRIITHIMYKANSNFIQLKKLLEGLVEKGLMDVERRPKRSRAGGRDLYKTTKKGKEVLKLLNKALEMLL